MLLFNRCSSKGFQSLLDNNAILLLSTVNSRHSRTRFLSGSSSEKQLSSNVVKECPANSQKATAEKPETDPWCHVDRATWEKAKPFEDMPGPRALPIIGNTWRFLPKIGEYSKILRGGINNLMSVMQQQFGNIIRLERVVGREDAVFLLSPEDIELVYKQESVHPERDILPSMTHFRETRRQEIFSDAKGLLASNGQEWYQFRNKVNSIMMQPKMVRQYLKPVDTIAAEFVEKIKRMRNSDNKIGDAFMNESNKWALETIAAMALDTRLGCLADDLTADSGPQKMVHNAQDVFSISEKLDFQPNLWKYITTPTFRKGMRIYNDQINLAQTYITAAMENIRKKKESGVQLEKSKEMSVLEKLLEIDPKVAVVMVSDMLLAGIDTTSTSFVNILYHLANNSIKQEKLREEILTLLPHKTSELKVEFLNQMPYLRACIKEAARLYPVTPGTMRNLTKDSVISGYKVPKGTKLIFMHMFVSVMENQFPRPMEFIPERWLRENGDSELSYKHAHAFSTMHFGFGPRSCIGRRFAELELEVAVVNFMRSLNVSWDGPPPVQATTSINYLRGPFNFVFRDNNLGQICID